MDQDLKWAFKELNELNFLFNDNFIKRLNIKKDIDSYLVNIDTRQKDDIFDLLKIIIYFIKIKFHISDDDIVNQLKMNKSRNLISLINLFLPYVDDKDNFYNFKSFTSLNDLVNRSIKTNDDTVNPYKFCNYSFDHSFIKNKREINDINGKVIYNEVQNESESNTTYLFTMYYLIINSIEMASYKLYVNWINVFPIGIR